MRISDLNTGLELIGRWNDDGAFQLPERQTTPAGYLPQLSPLDAVLGQKALDHQLVDLLLPPTLDSSLLEPTVWAATRKEIIANFIMRAEAEPEPADSSFRKAVDLMRAEDKLFSVIQSALAVLLRG